MIRRTFLKLLGLTAVGIAAPKLVVEREPAFLPEPPVVVFPKFDPKLHVFASPVQVHNYRQLGYNLADCKSLLIEDIPQEFIDRFLSEIPCRVNSDRRRIGRAIRKARREPAHLSQS